MAATKKNDKIETQDAEQIVSPELEMIKAQIAKMLEDAKAEADAILDDAKKKAEAIRKNEPVMTAEEKKTDDYWNEEVEIQLFKDSGRYSDDVYVAVNGENCLIQRGKPVKVKRKFAEVLRQSMEQDNETADMIRELTSSYEEKKDQLN